MLLAHFSDPHLTEPVPERARQLLNKRLLGFLSWRLRRRHHHSFRMLQALVGDARAHPTDHVLVSGDLTQVGLPREHAAGRRWLEGLGGPDRVTVLPGNHDAYVASPWEEGIGLWGPYAPGGEGGITDPAEDGFPVYREVAGVALIGLSTAFPSAPFLAVGRVGARQLQRLEGRLRWAGERGLFRIVALHHPPVAGVVRRRKALVDRSDLEGVLARAGAELLLFGHTHRGGRYLMEDGGSGIPALAVPAASALSTDPERRGGYNLIRVDGGPGAWEAAVSFRCLETLGYPPSWEPLPVPAV